GSGGAGHRGLPGNGGAGVLLPRRNGSGRSGYDVDAMAWSRRYELRQTGPEHAEVLRNDTRVARLLRGDPEPDRRYAVGWDLVADGVDRAMVHALAAAFRIGASTLRERIRAARQQAARERAVPHQATQRQRPGAPGRVGPALPASAQPAGVLLQGGVNGQSAGHHQAEQGVR